MRSTPEWTHAYPRDVAAALPSPGSGSKPALHHHAKYWSPIGRVDNVYGDRNLFCSCIPVADDA